jgi:hypothetical protein
MLPAFSSEFESVRSIRVFVGLGVALDPGAFLKRVDFEESMLRCARRHGPGSARSKDAIFGSGDVT